MFTKDVIYRTIIAISIDVIGQETPFQWNSDFFGDLKASAKNCMIQFKYSAISFGIVFLDSV